MPRLDLASIAVHTGSGYPAPFDQPVAGRERRRLGDAGGLTQFGVNLLRLPPGAWSSQRHWHSAEDEFVYVLSGELTLVTDAGAETLRAWSPAFSLIETPRLFAGASTSFILPSLRLARKAPRTCSKTF